MYRRNLRAHNDTSSVINTSPSLSHLIIMFFPPPHRLTCKNQSVPAFMHYAWTRALDTCVRLQQSANVSIANFPPIISCLHGLCGNRCGALWRSRFSQCHSDEKCGKKKKSKEKLFCGLLFIWSTVGATWVILNENACLELLVESHFIITDLC